MERAQVILIVDDDMDICYLLEEIFKVYNIPSTSVHTLEAAKTIINKFNPTHIILDYKLPDGYGTEFIKFLYEYHSNIKVILLTGDTEISEEAFGEIIRIIQKPFSLNTIKEVFQDIVQ